MSIYFFISLLRSGSAPLAASQWMAWPFTDYGWTSGFWPIVTKILFMGVIFVAMALVLRLLFGPKGPLRGQGWETMQEAREREEREQGRDVSPTDGTDTAGSDEQHEDRDG